MGKFRCWFVFLVLACLLTIALYSSFLRDIRFENFGAKSGKIKLSYKKSFQNWPLLMKNSALDSRSNNGSNFKFKNEFGSDTKSKGEVNNTKKISDDDMKYLTAYLKTSGTEIRKALAHTRGLKTRHYLQQSLSDVGTALELLGEEFPSVISRMSGRSSHICPEIYRNSQFITSNCNYGESIHNLLTIAIADRHYNHCVEVQKLIKSIHTFSPSLRVILGLSKCLELEENLNKEHGRTLTILLFTADITLGKIFNDLVGQVTTTYVLIARDVVLFNMDVQLERIIREMESQNLVSVGGSLRNNTGHWNMGCLQRVYQNFSMVYTSGYDESYHDCVFCDHIQGPFIIRSDQSQHIQFDPDLNITGLFEDYFHRLKGEIAICPDSLFYIHEPVEYKNVKNWTTFMEKYSLHKLKLPAPGPDIEAKCGVIDECLKNGGQMISPCCLQELSNLINSVMKNCIEARLNCELEEGTLLGALKLNKVSPWERGGDIRLFYKDFEEFGDLTKKFKDLGYVLVNKQNAVGETFVRGYQQGKYEVCSDNWCVEVRTMPLIDTVQMKRNKITPTFILHNGYYVTASRNPSLTSRNRYAPEIFRHAEHHTVLTINSWGQYPTGRFTECEEKGDHLCLNQYNGDGNLQFEDVIP